MSRLALTTPDFRLAGIEALFLFLGLAACWSRSVRAADPHAVGDDPAAIVIALDSEGGFRAPAAGGDDDYALCVKADGTASIRTHAPPERKTWRMKPEALQELLGFLLDEQKLPALESPVGQNNPLVADAGGWMIRVTVDGKTHEARGPMVVSGPANGSRRRFDLCLRRLQGTMTLVSLGGDEPAQRFLDAANAVFTKEWPGEKPLTLADVGFGSVLVSGAVDVPFIRGKKVLHTSAPALDGPITCTIVDR